jgi:hypothetical protein
MGIIELISLHRINVSWYGECVFLCKYDPNVSSYRSPDEVCIKLDQYENAEEALQAGIDKLLGDYCVQFTS